MRTTVTKVGFGIVAGAILTTMAVAAGSPAHAVGVRAGQPSIYQFDDPQYGGGQYGSGYDSGYGWPAYRRSARPVYPTPPSISPTAGQPTTAALVVTSATSPAGQVLAQINKVRAGAGARALAMNASLIGSARQHNLVMAGGCGLSHQCSGEGNPGTRISAQGLRWSSYAENIGYGGPVAATDAGQASMAVRLTQSMINEVAPNDGHRRNILNGSLGQIGIDVYRDAKGTVWITQDFAN